VRWLISAIDSAPRLNPRRRADRGLCADAPHGCKNVFALTLAHGAVGFSTTEHSCSGMFACSYLRKFLTPLTTKRNLMLTSRTFTLSRKCAARGSEEDC
jgi:hypothetical protein